MSGWTHLSGQAVALAQDNIDTDQLIPARFMSQPRSAGYGDFLLHDIRENKEAHPLDAGAVDVIVAGRNFGSGSSREAAVYALVDFGVRAVFAPSFGDIFASNAVNNGLLPARVDIETIEILHAALQQGRANVTVDLGAGEAKIAGQRVSFELDPVWREKLINGWDDIDLTAKHSDAINKFAAARVAAHPWAAPTT